MTQTAAQATTTSRGKVSTTDAFQNALARLGWGMPSFLESTAYPLTRLTKNYQLMNALYRDNWIVGRIIDVIPEDMCKNWYQISSQLRPDLIERLTKVERRAQVKARVLQGLKWGRLYGGAAGLLMIDGHEHIVDEPLDLDTVMPGAFKGIMVMDRWSGVYPESELVSDIGDPDFNTPAYYQVRNNATSEVYRVHHSRILRFTGYELPYWEAQAEVYWGGSIIERVYEELRKRDNTSYNIANLVFRANLLVRGIKDLDQMLATAPTQAQQEVYNTVQAANWAMNNFSMYVIDTQDTFDVKQTTFAGLAEVYENFMMDLSGAAEIPVTKLFGRSPAGLNATGESDLQNYYDMIESRQESHLRPVLDKVIPVLFVSELGAIPDDWGYDFLPVRRPSNQERSDLAAKVVESVVQVFNAGLISQQTALKELRQQEPVTGMWSNITDDDIARADDRTQPAGEIASDLSALGALGALSPSQNRSDEAGTEAGESLSGGDTKESLAAASGR